jgi:hypothetical protein
VSSDVEAFLLALGVLLGAVATLVTGFVQDLWRRKWERETESQRRVELRSEEAARELLPLFDEVKDALAPHTRYDSDTDDETLAKLSGRIRRLAVQVGDPATRARLEDIALAMTHTLAIMKFQGDVPSKVGRNCWSAGRNVAGHILGGEVLAPKSVIDDYKAAIEEDQALYEEMMDDERRARASTPEHPPSPDAE